MAQAYLSKRLCSALSRAAASLSSSSLQKLSSRTIATLGSSHLFSSFSNDVTLSRPVLESPWFAIQHRGAKILGSDVRLGNVIHRKGRILQVIKAQHTQQGRGGASIQVELRDMDSGNKTVERFRTEEPIETVFVEDKSYAYLYTEGSTVVLMEPDTYDQIEVSKDLFGKAAAYLKEDMTVTVQLYDGRAMSASVPKRVTCTVSEAQGHMKGLTAAPQYKKVLLDNGLTVQVPPFVVTGDQVIINTTDDSYITRIK